MKLSSPSVSLRTLAAIAFALSVAPSIHATGDWNSINLLEDHEFAAISSPEFWFELEMKEMARSLGVKEKHVEENGEEAAAEVPAKEGEENPKPKPKPKPGDQLDTEEGRLYSEGAAAYNEEKFPEAEAAWTKLLALPETKRKDRSVWAEYMLGRTKIATKQEAAAPPHFAKARELAASGFGDPHGLAAASYGWEAYVWKESDPEKAVALYLRQLATGNDRAVISIKFVIRSLWFPEMDMNADPNASTEVKPEAWERAAKSAILRPVVTRWYLAMTGDVHNRWHTESAEDANKGPENWLSLVEKAGPVAEEADRVAWLAYRNGKYEIAQRWLKLAGKETRLSLWLTAKLALRAGDSAKAAAAMEKAAALYKEPEQLAVSNINMQMSLPKAAAMADEAAMQLSQNKFPEALTAFINAGYWQDAAYVAERVLSLEELKAYVDQHYPTAAKREEKAVNHNVLGRVVKVPEGEADPEQPGYSAEFGPAGVLQTLVIHGQAAPDAPAYKDAVAWRLRWLLGRRMVREDQEAASRPYLPRDVQPVLDAYVSALKKAADAATPKAEVAKNWWIAAWIARVSGMELMGTELGPDNAWDGGTFAGYNLATARRTGVDADPNSVDYDSNDVTKPPKKTVKLKFSLPPTAEEKKRLAKSALPREYRFHYRWVAATLAKKAAALLGNNTEEKADVLNQAGSWLFDRDEKGEEAIFDEIKRTCANTVIGKAVLAKKHTFPQSGPWSGTSDESEEP